jgi:flagellum-specific peptidoglycan hydrolase FlgJ
MAKLKTKADYQKMTNKELVDYLDKLDQKTFEGYVDGNTKTRYFIDKYGAYYIKALKGTNLFISAVMGQAMTESTWGRSNVAVNTNNVAGIKYNKNIHPAYWTAKNGVKWAKFDSPEEGINFHVKTLMSDRYKNARLNSKSPEEQIKNIVGAGYDNIPPETYLKKMKDNLNRVRKTLPFGKID